MKTKLNKNGLAALSAIAVAVILMSLTPARVERISGQPYGFQEDNYTVLMNDCTIVKSLAHSPVLEVGWPIPEFTSTQSNQTTNSTTNANMALVAPDSIDGLPYLIMISGVQVIDENETAVSSWIEFASLEWITGAIQTYATANSTTVNWNSTATAEIANQTVDFILTLEACSEYVVRPEFFHELGDYSGFAPNYIFASITIDGWNITDNERFHMKANGTTQTPPDYESHVFVEDGRSIFMETNYPQWSVMELYPAAFTTIPSIGNESSDLISYSLWTDDADWFELDMMFYQSEDYAPSVGFSIAVAGTGTTTGTSNWTTTWDNSTTTAGNQTSDVSTAGETSSSVETLTESNDLLPWQPAGVVAAVALLVTVDIVSRRRRNKN